jgi:hypothetical protein
MFVPSRFVALARADFIHAPSEIPHAEFLQRNFLRNFLALARPEFFPALRRCLPQDFSDSSSTYVRARRLVGEFFLRNPRHLATLFSLREKFVFFSRINSEKNHFSPFFADKIQRKISEF